jgi:carboxymethylenebutenolidase
MVQFPANGGSTSGYLSAPDGDRGPGLVVIQEWWGLVDHIKDVTDRFAREGFVALAPDLFHGKTTTDPNEAGQLLGSLSVDQAAKDLRGAIDYLLDQAGATGGKVGVIGFCMGGQIAMFAGTVSPDKVGAVANFYGIHPVVQQATDLTKLKAPVLGTFAEGDQMTPPSAAQELEQRVRQQGLQTDFKVYPGTTHAFFNDTRKEVYNADAARDAWDRSLRWFKQHLS